MKNQTKEHYEELRISALLIEPEHCLAVSNLSFKYGNLELEDWGPDEGIDAPDLENDVAFPF